MIALPTEIHIWQARLGSGPHRRRVAARRALRGVLGRYLGENPAEIGLRVGARGKPMLAEPADSLRFNLSHSRDRAVIAVTRGREVGVDIEWIDPRRDVLALAPRALGRAAARSVAEVPTFARAATFHAAWARREAIAKCLGVGLWAPLPESDVAVSTLDAGPGFAAAIAVAGGEVPPLRRFVIEPGLVSAPLR